MPSERRQQPDRRALVRGGGRRADDPPLTIKERLDHARQMDYITVEEGALLVGVSERTIWRRLPKIERVIRDGRITRVHRVTLLRHFLKWPPIPPLSTS